MVTQTCNGTRPVAAVAWQSRSRISPELIDVAERVIQQWLLAHQGQIHHGRQQAWRSCEIRQWRLARRGQGQAAPTANGGKPANVGPYLAISRESGTGGGQIARLVGEMTGWAVLDRELLECLAELYRTSPAVLNLVDETTTQLVQRDLRQRDSSGLRCANGIHVSPQSGDSHGRAGRKSHLRRARCALPIAAPARFDRSAGRLARISGAADRGTPAPELRQGPRLRGKDGRRPARVCPTILPSRHCRSAPVRLDGQRRTDRAASHCATDSRRSGIVLRCTAVILRSRLIWLLSAAITRLSERG